MTGLLIGGIPFVKVSKGRANEMPSPQFMSAAPEKLCPKCGVKMQVISMTPSSYLYACYKHPEGTFYLTSHHSFKVNEDGSIKEKA